MSNTRSEATEDEIAVCAYFIWEQEGKPIGHALDHWFQAELQLAASLWHESLCIRRGERRPLRMLAEADEELSQALMQSTHDAAAALEQSRSK
jgi:DUF2934 family protein